MKIGLISAMCIAIVFLVVTSSAQAHHGDADRYNQDVVVIKGTVIELLMTNPHAHIVLDVVADGKTIRWQAELGGPQQLVRQFGWTPSMMKKGTNITLTGRRLKSGAPYMNLTERANVVLTDTGKEIYRTENFGQPAPKP